MSPSVYIGLVAVFFYGMGLFGLVAPQSLIAPFHISLPSVVARGEVRAVYGGFGVFVGLLLTYCLFSSQEAAFVRGVLICLATSLCGMAFGRVVTRLSDDPFKFFPIWFYFWVELGLAALLYAAT